MLEASLAAALAPRPAPVRRHAPAGRFVLTQRVATSLAEA